MVSFIITATVCLIIGFVVGMFVFKNNKEKAEAVTDKLEDLADDLKDKFKR